MDGTEQITDLAGLRDLVTAELVTKAIYVANEMGISDKLENGGKNVSELADLCDADASSLYRLLRLLASYGIYSEVEEGRFCNTPIARAMMSRRGTLNSFIKMFSSEWNQKPFSSLLAAVKTGESAFELSMGTTFFDYMNKAKSAESLFNDVMTDFLSPVHKASADAYDFKKFNKIVDVGGGHGSLMSEILNRNTNVSGIIYDLPSVIEGTKVNINNLGLSDKIEVTAGDFFESIPKGGDAYVLCRVLHDWEDDKCIKILKNCREAINPDGKLIVVEQIIYPGNERSFTKVTDLWMMMMFHHGRERTQKEFEKIFELSGFKLEEIYNTRVTDRVIEAKPI